MSFGMCSQKSLKISDYKSHKDDRSISHTTIIENANKSKIEKFSQLPILTETSENKFNSSTKTAEQSKNNTCKPKPVVSCTRSSREQILGIDLLQKKDRITYVSSFSKEVTHLIVQTKDGNCLKDHTIKYVLGVAAGIWILNYDWIVKCLEKNTIVDEVPNFERQIFIRFILLLDCRYLMKSLISLVYQVLNFQEQLMIDVCLRTSKYMQHHHFIAQK